MIDGKEYDAKFVEVLYECRCGQPKWSATGAMKHRKRSDTVRKRRNSNRKSRCNTMREQSDFDDEVVQPQPSLLEVDISGAVNATFHTQGRLAA